MSGGSDTHAPASPGDRSAPPGPPILPATSDSDAAQTLPGTPPGTSGGAPVGAYRSEQQRARSVYRRANPWYRRLARGAVGLGFLLAAGGALYFGARELQDYLNRDRLPSAGVEIPSFRQTSFQVASSAPAPVLDGTITVDVTTRAFEFTGRAAGAQSGARAVSLDGSRILIERGGGWEEAGADDPLASALSEAIPFFVGVDNADDVLVNRMRNGYVDLVDKTTEGVGDDARDRYTLEFDYAAYSTAQPLQWEAYQQEVVPGITELPAAGLTIWLDANDVVVRMLDPQTNWTWERLAYSEQEFDPDPTGEIAAATGL